MDVGLRDLELFMALAEETHFTRAAALKGTSQPTLSRAVGRLERALDARLVVRTTRSVALTPAGERLRSELAAVLPQLDAAIRAVKESDVLRLGFTWLLPSSLTKDLIGRLEKATGSQVQLVRCDDRWGGVADGRTDAAIVYAGTGTAPSVHTVELTTEPRIVAVARDHPLARRRRLHWSELSDYPLVVNAVSGTVGTDIWPGGRQPAVVLSSRNYDEAIETVAAGRGIGVLPASGRQHPHPGVRYIAVPDAPEISLELVLPTHAPHPLAEILERLAREARPGTQGQRGKNS
ncbi:LysR family transcriptional regulator [Paenarthrobacter sp. DKR-5]|uniref:LysR family transcriptional regulator n=1 Tax=Paenarthrobacter sp. DKR-5 TaxID=2835535 RepID=UPI001BDC13AE|nr:LysR family transcriptional regulator [Paenarthrobacter sp. DKR-5]MBT1004292.1 LysR family transcriptional regulator [Paenarthrobacter sp. DKR-5]